MPPPLKKKLYVGCALSSLPKNKGKEFLSMISRVKFELSQCFEILEFLGTGPATPEEVYCKDIIQCLSKADCMLGICDHLSLGLGYEICYAAEKLHIPVLAVAHVSMSANVSRLIRGIHGKRIRYVFTPYHSVRDIVSTTVTTFLDPKSRLFVV